MLEDVGGVMHFLFFVVDYNVAMFELNEKIPFFITLFTATITALSLCCVLCLYLCCGVLCCCVNLDLKLSAYF